MTNQTMPAEVRSNDGLGGSAHIERKETMLHPQLANGALTLSVYLSNYCDSDLDEVMARWVESEDEVSINCSFRLTDSLDSAIELHEMPSMGGAIDAAALPLFMAMRSELAEMLTRIDALKFEPPNARDQGAG